MSDTRRRSRFQTYNSPIQIGVGQHGSVYKISDTEVGKIIVNKNGERTCGIIGREMMIAKKLYKMKVSVPKPLAWDTIRFSDGKLEQAFIMQFIKGKTGTQLEGNEGCIAEKLVDLEINLVKDSGFDPVDYTYSGNYILTPNKQIVLLDFASWSHPDVPQYVNPREVFK